MEDNKHEEHQLINYGTYIMVWLALLILTGLTVTVAGLNLKNFAIAVAILIAGFKSTLVLNYFMHLKFESALFKNMVFVTIFTLAIIIILTFTDILFR
jgi:cytochrome c oxidase subunit 4